jgi:autotransporter passenger strand-loop-strand repeat protein
MRDGLPGIFLPMSWNASRPETRYERIGRCARQRQKANWRPSLPASRRSDGWNRKRWRGVRVRRRHGQWHDGAQRRIPGCPAARDAERHDGHNRSDRDLIYQPNSGVTVDATSATDTVIASGGTEFVHSGGAAISTTIGAAGIVLVSSGGTAGFTTMSSAAGLVILPGGAQTSTTVLTVGQIVSTGIVLVQANSQVTVYGLIAIDVAVGSGATAYVLRSGTTSASTVNSGGTEIVYSGGTTTATTVSTGGSEVVFGSGVTVSTTLDNGAGSSSIPVAQPPARS